MSLNRYNIRMMAAFTLLLFSIVGSDSEVASLLMGTPHVQVVVDSNAGVNKRKGIFFIA